MWDVDLTPGAPKSRSTGSERTIAEWEGVALPNSAGKSVIRRGEP
jgi:hypothetical protein